jgi:small subunit ribosomal protein S15
MALATDVKKQIVNQFAVKKNDTGSPEVQVALLSRQIVVLTEHFKTHKKDHSSRRGLLSMVAHRRRLLKYLKASSPERYKVLISSLGIRH